VAATTDRSRLRNDGDDVARPATVLTTKAVRDSVQPSFSWSYAGRRRLKRIADPVALYRVRAS
jgi:class 3 adenylate cyclase